MPGAQGRDTIEDWIYAIVGDSTPKTEKTPFFQTKTYLSACRQIAEKRPKTPLAGVSDTRDSAQRQVVLDGPEKRPHGVRMPAVAILEMERHLSKW